MLVTKKEFGKKFWLRIHITLRENNATVENVDSSEFQFRLHCKTKSFTFNAESKSMKEAWLEDIQYSILGARDKKLLSENQIKNSVSDKNENEEVITFNDDNDSYYSSDEEISDEYKKYQKKS